MTMQQSRVLAVVIHGGSHGTTASEIAFMTGYPEPSIRCTIQALIRLGENISFALDGRYLWRDGVN